MIPGLEFHTITSFDGSEIAYQACGHGPAVVLANGLGGTYAAWRHVMDALGRGYRILTWDYRGLFRSGPPKGGALDIVSQARDLAAILEHEKIERVLLGGWSMGTHVILEHHRLFPERTVGMFVVCGIACSPGEGRVHPTVAKTALAALRSSARLWGPFARASVASGVLLPWLARLGVVGPTADPEVIQQVAADWNLLDFEMLVANAGAIADSDCRDVLPTMNVPALLIGGDRDFQAPLSVMREMAQALPHARLVEVAGGTHYTPIEFPRLVQKEVADFVAELGWGQPDFISPSARFQSTRSRM